MSELEAILHAVHDWSVRGLDFVLATVVGTRGSTYRGLAARQLVGADGTSVGTVSGGCLDRDLHEVAGEVMESGRARLIEFDLTADDEAIWGWGIGCNGATELLVEPAATARALADRLARIRAEQRPTAVVHIVSDGGRRAYVSEAGVEGELSGEVVEAARRALADGRHRSVTLAGERLLIEVVSAPSRLVVCGAGHDARPLVRFGADLGFEVTVVDDRRQFLTTDRFPEATALVCTEPRELASVVDLDGRTHVILMSHNYLRDLDYLRSLVGTEVAYVGALGPGARLERLLKDLEAEGMEVSEDDLAKLHGPAGLDIGAEGPTEIAWAILGEVLAFRRDGGGGFLSHRKGPPALRT